VHGYVQIVRDLSERRRVEALESEGRRIAEFISMLSHELRNPLAPISNAATILGKLVETPEARWCAEIIERQVTHLARLVDDLLEVSRVTSGKLRIERVRQDLGALVRQATESARSTLDGFGHALTLRLDDAPLPVLGDATRLQQVMVNLLNNAAKNTPNGGHITVSLLREGPSARVQVADDGIGMSEALIARAFEPFVQGERTLDRPQGGLGIGLTLAKTIVEAHGGTISIASAGADRGTTVTVMLPIADVDHADALGVAPRSLSSSAAVAPGGAGAGVGHAMAAEPVAAAPYVLVVDDNVDAALSLAHLLRAQGHEVSIAHDGAQALALAAQRAPQVVLLDVGLPGMDGYELARRLRQFDTLGKARLIAVTGYGQQRDRDASLRAGFEAHLVKPIDADDLASLLAATG
jgi:CheY-like chemotaxis protein